MAVKPEVRTMLDLLSSADMPSFAELTPPQVRELYGSFSGMASRTEVASVADRTIPGPRGPLPVRVYRPEGVGAQGAAPVLVWFHGGGFVIGDLDTSDPNARDLAVGAEAVVVSVDYRLAPEHPFPDGVDDAVAAVRWVADNAAELGVDPGRLAVGGDSAGGNLAAVVSQQLRGSGVSVRFQLLVYPVADLSHEHPSLIEFAEGYFLTREEMAWFTQHYLGDRVEALAADPRVSPLRAEDEALVGLPSALVITAEYDPLRDEGEAYAGRLRDAGVDVTVTRYDGMIHGFFGMGDVIPDGKAAVQEAAAALRDAFTSQEPPAVT
jgi:acetyl esterase/lipase